MVCPIFRIGGQLVRTIAMVARFDQAAEITLDELRVELMYPFDDAADRFFRRRQRTTEWPGRIRRGGYRLSISCLRLARTIGR
jgi:hypothetical protein